MRLDVATGTVLGREHARLHRNNQDAYAAWVSAERAVVAVADGCSAARSSEVGAKLACAWIAAHGARTWAELDGAEPEVIASRVFAGVSTFVARTTRALSPDAEVSPAVIAEHFLFTLLVALVDRRRALVFGLGDGAIVLDGEVRRLDAGPENAPPYLAYALLDPAALEPTPARLAPLVHHAGPAEALASIAIATDGAAELELRRGEALRDGSTIEGLGALAHDPRWAARPGLLEKRLLAIGAVNGRLHDDATIAVIRRTPGEVPPSVSPSARAPAAALSPPRTRGGAS